MTLISSSNSPTSFDHVSTIRAPLNFNSWMTLFNVKSFSIQDRTLFWQGLHDHPEWLNQTDRYQRTPLIKASEHWNFESVNALIEVGVDLNLQDQDGWTALMHASYQGNIVLVQVLIESGADVNLQDQDGCTALMWASSQGKTVLAQTLIEVSADLNLQDQEGWTALMYASHRGHVDVAHILIHQGADLEVMNPAQQTALDLARTTGNDAIIRLLEAYRSGQILNQVVNPLEASSEASPLNPSAYSFSKKNRL